MTAVLDASAVLALIYREPGHERVTAALDDATISTVNYAEVVQKLTQRNHPNPTATAGRLASLGVNVAPFTASHAVRAAQLWSATRVAGLLLGDRACLALAASITDSVALTCDQAWARLDISVHVELIR